MYHCNLHIYLTGKDTPIFDWIKALEAKPSFTHIISEERVPTAHSAAGADVIFLDLEDQDPASVLPMLIQSKREDAQLIVLAPQGAAGALEPYYGGIFDIWPLDMSQKEADFRLGRWQYIAKGIRDHWQVKQYLDAVINATPNMIWFKTKDGIHEKVNDGFCAIVGKDRDVVQGKDHCFIWDVGPEDAEVCAQTDRMVMEAGKTVTAEESVLSGNERLLLTTYKSPLYDLDGSVMGTVGVGIDITKERAYQTEIVRRNHTMETIFTSLNCGVLCHSLDGTRIISVNDAALKMLDYATAEEMASNGFHMVAQSVLDEDKPILRDCITKLKNVGDSSDVEYRVLHKDGRLLHILGNIKLVEENGEVFYQRFLLDVTAQKLQEQEYQRRQMALIQALGIDFNIVCAFNLKTGEGNPLRLKLPQKTAQSLALPQELTLEQFTENCVREFVYEPDRELFRHFLEPAQLAQALEERQAVYVDCRVVVDGNVQYYEVKAVRTDGWGERQDMVLGLRSVDEFKREEMKQRQLLEDALIQANRANAAKSTFLSNMSHDIRTPMNAIVGFTSLAITHQKESEKVSEYLGKIRTSSEHLLRLLNDVLDMSAIESGKMQLSESPHDLIVLLDELRSIEQAAVQAKSLNFQIDYSAVTDRSVYCDKLRLDQVLLNIISNAIRYTPDGGDVTLTVTQAPALQSGHRTYTFRLKDTGIGMSPEFLTRVFDPFERERNTTTSGIQGTGLGMAITKNIVDMMDGTVKVDSVQGQGTTVTITVTFRLSEETQASAVHDGARSVRTAAQHNGCRLLLVEDNELNREIAEDILADAGFIAEVAENGRVALDMLTSHPADYYKLVLMDVQMPVMDGYEATRAIRALPDKDLAAIPILAMTANAFEEDKKEALRCGMNGHIAKPVDVDQLIETLDQIID